MATDPDRIFVAGDAHLFIGPVTAAAPQDPDAGLDPALVEVGYFAEDTLSFSHVPSFEAVVAHQSDWPAVYVQTSEESTVSAELQEWSEPNFRLAFGGGQVTEDSPGIWRFSPPQLWEEYEFMAVVRCRDGARRYDLVIPRAISIGGAEMALGKGSAATLPVQITCTGEEDSRWHWVTTDPVPGAFGVPAAGAALPYPSESLYPSTSLYPGS